VLEVVRKVKLEKSGAHIRNHVPGHQVFHFVLTGVDSEHSVCDGTISQKVKRDSRVQIEANPVLIVLPDGFDRRDRAGLEVDFHGLGLSGWECVQSREKQTEQDSNSVHAPENAIYFFVFVEKIVPEWIQLNPVGAVRR
jgi:hypothetical protein